MGRIPHHPLIEKHFTHPPEWRMNPTTGQWVIIAPERAGRPVPRRPRIARPPSDDPCPFCSGNEHITPGELGALRIPGTLPNQPGWRVRAFPNAYAAVKKFQRSDPANDGFYLRANAVGRHEVIIECPQHETNLSRLPVEQIREVVRLWRDRMLEASRDPELKYSQLFKNHGPAAGASVEHAHSQMLATPSIPVAIEEELAFASRFFEDNGACAYCELLRREQKDGTREIIDTSEFVVVAAYAARQPFESLIVPKTHHSQFELIGPNQIEELGEVLSTILRKMDAALDAPAYNLVFHSGPFHVAPQPHYHWHVEVLPRLSQVAGYEWGSGSYVTPILPEDAAIVLKETEI